MNLYKHTTAERSGCIFCAEPRDEFNNTLQFTRVSCFEFYGHVHILTSVNKEIKT